MSGSSGDFTEFTEVGFRNLLRQMKTARYRFARYGENAGDRHVIWRHDVNCSMHRAAMLAAIEAEEGVPPPISMRPPMASKPGRYRKSNVPYRASGPVLN